MNVDYAWPSDGQLALLKAALLPADSAEQYWHEFIANNDFQNLDHGCNQVLPMAFINLRGRIEEDVNEKICRSSYKYVWAKNHVLMHDAKALLILLKENDIEACILKGAAYIGHYYPDYGMRVLGDIDLLVSGGQMQALVDVLESNGYKLKSGQGGVDTRSLLRMFHARSFVNARGTDFDVHQYLSPYLIDAELSERIWQNKKSIDLFGSEGLTYVLSPTYQLLHTILHGLQYATESSIRWIIDAACLLRNCSADIDWDELMDVCSRHHLNLPMSQGLGFLAKEMRAPIPENVISHFEEIEITEKDRSYYVSSSNLGFMRTMQRIRRSWGHYKSYSAGSAKKAKLFGFYDFLLVYLEIESRWMLVPHIVKKTFAIVCLSIRRFFRRIFAGGATL